VETAYAASNPRRPLLYQAPVDPVPDDHRAHDLGDDVLATGTRVTNAITSGSVPVGLAVLRARAKKLLDVTVSVWIFSGGLVLFEPSPYEITFLVVLVLAVIANISLFRSVAGLLAILLSFIPFALIAVLQVRYTTIEDAILFSLVTIFLMLTSYLVANYVAEATERRMRLVMNAYTAAAVICALVGTLGYFGLIPGSDLFTRHGRAKATFNDPNVFGPFLILPAMFALQRALLGSGRQQVLSALVYGILFVGVFFSFSRGAWGHFAGSSIIVLMLCFFLEANVRDKIRVIVLALVAAALMAVAFAVLVSMPEVAEFFDVRAQGQVYDLGETGRFGRQSYALELALDNPFGLGPLEFRHLRIIEDPHNVYVTVLHHYGWGGGAMYYLLVVLTLWRGLRGLLRPSPFRLMMGPLFATFSMLTLESAIVDTDHWRHWFLVAGLVWGVSAAAQMDQRRTLRRDRVLI
jgi:O-antigen ligase